MQSNTKLSFPPSTDISASTCFIGVEDETKPNGVMLSDWLILALRFDCSIMKAESMRGPWRACSEPHHSYYKLTGKTSCSSTYSEVYTRLVKTTSVCPSWEKPSRIYSESLRVPGLNCVNKSFGHHEPLIIQRSL